MEEFTLKCGAKCFLVEMKTDGKKQTKTVRARTPVAARKVIRSEYGDKTQILKVREEDRKS